jgi:hypothetical protein
MDVLSKFHGMIRVHDDIAKKKKNSECKFYYSIQEILMCRLLAKLH